MCQLAITILIVGRS